MDSVIQILHKWGEISTAVGYFKKANAFIVFTICFLEAVHHKWFLNKEFGEMKMAKNAVLLRSLNSL